MERHFVSELENLKSLLIRMGSLVEGSVGESLAALAQRRGEVAEGVIGRESQVNALETEIDNFVVDLLALQQPVASDLRFILAALKINNDLERIGDHAVNIAESAISCAARPPVPVPADMATMGERVREMLKDALDGFIHSKTDLCRRVLATDDLVDSLNRKVVTDLMQLIRSDAGSLDAAQDLIRVSRNLERIADLATNIAEDVIFVAEAKVVKHTGAA